jgi:hypothetical protein
MSPIGSTSPAPAPATRRHQTCSSFPLKGPLLSQATSSARWPGEIAAAAAVERLGNSSVARYAKRLYSQLTKKQAKAERVEAKAERVEAKAKCNVIDVALDAAKCADAEVARTHAEVISASAALVRPQDVAQDSWSLAGPW